MRLLLTFLALATIPLSEARGDLLQCVDEDVVTAFLERGFGSTRTISRDMPTEYSELAKPSRFTFIGSSVTDNTTSVAYKTPLDVQKAERSMLSALQSMGWQKLPDPKPRRHRPGFQSSIKFPRHFSLCQNNSAMGVSVRREPAGTYVVLTTQHQGQTSCSMTVAMLGRMANDFLPELALPPSVATPAGSGNSGSDDYASTRVQFKSKESYSALHSFFSMQLEEQGWVQDTTWDSTTTIGSVWSNRPEQGIQVSGMLQVLQPTTSASTIVTFSIHLFESTD